MKRFINWCITFWNGGTPRTKVKVWHRQEGQDIAEYAVMLAVILVIVIGTVKLIGTSANTAFATVASTLGPL